MSYPDHFTRLKTIFMIAFLFAGTALGQEKGGDAKKWTEVAEKATWEEECVKIPTLELRQKCYRNLAVFLAEINLCYKSGPWEKKCQEEVAVALKHDQWIRGCLNRGIYGREDKKRCWENFGRFEAKNRGDCSKIPIPDIREICKEKFLFTEEEVKERIGERGMEVVLALKARDFKKLSSFVHPEKGVRFSSYAYVTEEDFVFKAEEVKKFSTRKEKLLWGSYDGTGDPIRFDIENYFRRFVYNKDFAHAPKVSFNRSSHQGNDINNALEFYRKGIYVEYHFPPSDPEKSGTDWASLRLVFQEKDGVWYLVGIIHDEWTI